ncbi:MAG: hypothetical protein JWQ78_1354, partial [Sediminibacterium sp.]|nr:hypothetical protein [Sediminibacterium sp.]
AKDIIGSGSDFSLKFLHECKNLLRKIPNGNAVLYQRAKETVDRYLREIGSGKKSSQLL